MKIHFGLQFDNEKVWDFGIHQDFDNLILGPVGLVNFLKEELGEFGPREDSINRILHYEKALSEFIVDYPSLVDSFKVDSFAFASKLLEIRDWLKLNDVIHKDWSEDNLRFHLIEKTEGVFLADGFSDDFITVKNQLKNIVFEDDFSILLYNELDSLPLYLRFLFEQFNSDTIVEYKLDFDNLPKRDLQNLAEYIRGASPKSINGDESLLVTNVVDEEELIPHLAEASQNNEVLLVGENLPDSLDSVIEYNNGNTLGVSFKKTGDYWKQLPELLLCLGEERLDVRKVFQLLNHKFTVFGKATDKIKRQLQKSQSFDYDNWFTEWESKQFENYNEIKQSVQNWLVNRPLLFAENGLAKSEGLISFYKDVVKVFDSYEFKGFSLQNYSEFKSDINKTVEFLKGIDKVDLSRLKTVFRRIRTGKTIAIADNMTQSATRCKSPGNIVHVSKAKQQTILVLNGFEIDDKGLNKLLFESEIKSLESIDSDLIKENGIKIWREDICRLLISSQQVVLVNILNRKGELQEKPFLINLIEQLGSELIEKELASILPVNYTNSDTRAISDIKPRLYWNLKDKTKKKIKFKTTESFSSIDELIHYPHAYFLNNSMGIYPKGMPDFEAVFAAMGILSHAVIEHLVNNNNLDASNQEIEELTEELITSKAAILNIPKFRLHALEVKMNISRAVPQFYRMLMDMKIENLSIQMEKKVVKDKSVFDVGLKGFIDVVLYSGEKPVAIIDIKYTGYNKRKNDIENSSDYQLAIYSRLMDDDTLPKGYFLVKEAKLMTNHRSFFGKGANVFKFSNSTEQQIIQLVTAVKRRKAEINAGNVEIGINEERKKMHFWNDLNFAVNPSWTKGRKDANIYEKYTNLLG